MKIWELLKEENINKGVINSEKNLYFVIGKVEENEDIVLLNAEKERMAISKLLIEQEWELVDVEFDPNSISGEEYYYLDDMGLIKSAYNADSVKDELRKIAKNYYTYKKDLELVKAYMNIIKTFTTIKDSYKGEENDKVFVVYDSSVEEFKATSLSNKALSFIGSISFQTKELALKAIEEVKEDLEIIKEKLA